MSSCRTTAKKATLQARLLGAGSVIAGMLWGCDLVGEQAAGTAPAPSISQKQQAVTARSAPGSASTTATQPGPAAVALDVQFLGCKAIQNKDNGRLCIPNENLAFVLWAPDYNCTALRLMEDSKPLRTTEADVAGGCRLKRLDKGTAEHATLTLNSRASGAVLWRLELDRSRPALFEIKNGIAGRPLVDLDGVVTEFWNKVVEQPPTETVIDLQLARALAFRRQGYTDRAVTLFREVKELASRASYPTISWEASYRLCNIFQDAGELAEVENELRVAEQFIVPGMAKQQMAWNLTKAILQRAKESMEEAVESYRRILIDAERLDDRELMRIAAPLLAQGLARLDRPQEAEALFPLLGLLLEGTNACSKAALLANFGWVYLDLAMAVEPPSMPLRVGRADVKQLFDDAWASQEQCTQSDILANILHAQARIAFVEQRSADAQSLILKARKEPGLAADDKMELLELEARLALRAGRAEEALSLFQQMQEATKKSEEFRARFQCEAALGTLESLQAHTTQPIDTALSANVRACLDGKVKGVTPLHVKRWNQHARAAKLIP